MAGKFDTEEIKAFAAAWRAAVESGARLSDFAGSLGVSKSNAAARRRRVEKALGIELPSFAGTPGSRTQRDARRKLAKRGWSPEHDMTHVVPDGYNVKGTSTLYDSDGKVAAQWVKSDIDRERQAEMLKAVIDSLKEGVEGLADPIKAPRGLLADSLSAYVIGDAHFGAYAWDEECGENFDTAIASRDLRAAIDLLVDGSPASETAYLVDVGDFLHADNRSNQTPASGNQLDVDTRYQRVIRVAMSALQYCIGRALQKHKRVKVFVTPGNHNPDSAGWMALVLEAFFRREPRVEVETSPAKFFYQQFGNNLIGITHGDKVKMADLPSIMATDRPKAWGETRHRIWLTGHIHHTQQQEFRGCFVESFNTLAAGDAWHHASGYRSKRQMQRIDFHRETGIYARGIANIEMIRPNE